MSSVRKELEELAVRIGKEAADKKQADEQWDASISNNRIWLNLSILTYSMSEEINEENCSDLESLMASMSGILEQQRREDEKYARALLEKCGPGT